MTIRLLLVDDHDMVRLGLSTYLSMEEDLEVAGEARNGKEALAQVKALEPDVVLMDLQMETMNGIEATAELQKLHRPPKVIVLTSFLDDEMLYPVLEAGAFSYLLKTSTAEEIAAAVRSAGKGEAVFTSSVTSRMVEGMRRRSKAKHNELTKREMEVLLELGRGKTNQEMSQSLFIGIKTVKTHVSHILQKLELEDRTQAAIYVHEQRLLDHAEKAGN
ncbi:response regulator transcription factor [Alkalicoccus luteus]|uniref:response regulator transcription factor n=1 Tax=Alkalicoccus luteus TaxID=1237094 RepID=UPI0040340816